jgi:hypothetical protein
MYKRLDRAHRAVPLVLGVVTLVSVGVLLAWHLNPKPKASTFDDRDPASQDFSTWFLF